jgi:trans-2,3-dihydro-3-hydroxyanthranilate isomerase
VGMQSQARPYAIFDVFSDRALAGNPLAVVFEADGLDDAALQGIAAEFNLSETVFVLSPQNAHHTAHLRIFTPVQELPFAGHPTVGAAVALAHRRNGSAENGAGHCDTVLMLEERAGNIRAVVSMRNHAVDDRPAGFAEFDLPRLPRQVDCIVKRDQVADALGINPGSVGFENHVVSVWSAGVPYVLIPVRDRTIAENCQCDPARWEALAPIDEGILASAFVYCRGGIDHSADFHARMFAPCSGTPEDPATGSAVAALAGAVNAFDDLLDGHHIRIVEQGIEMGRPSKIHLHMDVTAGRITRARLGGAAVRVAEGLLYV